MNVAMRACTGTAVAAAAFVLVLGAAQVGPFATTDRAIADEPTAQTSPFKHVGALTIDCETDGDLVSQGLVAQHDAYGIDISGIDEVTTTACVGCHGGDYDAMAQVTEDMWEGIGQINDANPHNSHAINGYIYGNCHKLDEAPVNQCNGCHSFASPAGWIDKDCATTAYGIAQDEPLY